MTVKRIGLFGNFGAGNTGNEASLEAMLLFVRQNYPEADLVCICSEPKIIEAQFKIRSLPIFTPRHSARGTFEKLRNRWLDHLGVYQNIRNFDALLIPGTGFLDDFGERPVGMPYMIFLICLAARLRGIKIAFVSTGAGPIVHPLSRWFMKSAAKMASYRSYRDEISKEFMASIGLDVTKDTVYPDLAFKLPTPQPDEVREGMPLTIGIGVMTYNGWKPAGGETIYETYMRKMTHFALELLKSGYRLRILAGDVQDKPAMNDLESAIRNEAQEIGEEAVIAEMPHDLHDVMRQIHSVDAVIATRFHNVLCALKLGKPTISIGYAKKNDVLMEGMGLGEFCQHIEKLDVELLMQQFNKLIDARASYEDTVKMNGRLLRKRLEQQEQLLSEQILQYAV